MSTDVLAAFVVGVLVGASAAGFWIWSIATSAIDEWGATYRPPPPPPERD